MRGAGGSLETLRCPRCDLGFAPSTRACPVCHVPLSASADRPAEEVERYEEIPPEGAGAPETAEPPASAVPAHEPDDLVPLRTVPPAWARALLERLSASAIPARTKPSARPPDLTVFVREADRDRAAGIDREVLAAEVPQFGRPPDVEAFDASRCPACGATVAAHDEVCPECGLVLDPAEGWRCGRCDATLEPDTPLCPACGAGVDWSSDRER